MNLNKLEYLTIAHNKYNYYSDIKNIDYKKWINYINYNSGFFMWAEDTEEGKETLSSINEIPESFRERVLISLNKHRCFASYNENKDYNASVSYYGETIGINFEHPPEINDLKIYLSMANYLDALLLKDGTKVIDEEVIKKLENKNK